MTAVAQSFALADNHRRRQAVVAAQVQQALRLAWDRVMSLDDLDRSFAVFYRTAVPLIGAGRRLSLREAQRYYLAAARNAGIPVTRATARLDMPDLPPGRLETTLRISGPVTVKQALIAGHAPTAAMTMAQASVMRTAKKHIIDASRHALIEKITPSRHLPQSELARYAWVADGDPCAWCALWVARGPVYTKAGAGSLEMKTHAGCGCTPQLVFLREEGASVQAQRYQELLDVTSGNAAYRLKADNYEGLNEFRRAIYAARKDPDSVAARILRGEA